MMGHILLTLIHESDTYLAFISGDNHINLK